MSDTEHAENAENLVAPTGAKATEGDKPSQLDLTKAAITKNDIVSGRVQKVIVDGSVHDVRASLGISDGEHFNAITTDGPVPCILATMVATNNAMKATISNTSTRDLSNKAGDLTAVLFRRA